MPQSLSLVMPSMPHYSHAQVHSIVLNSQVVIALGVALLVLSVSLLLRSPINYDVQCQSVCLSVCSWASADVALCVCVSVCVCVCVCVSCCVFVCVGLIE